MQQCRKCLVDKEPHEFYKGRKQCKQCVSAYFRQYHQANRDAILARQRKHREENPEKVKAAQARWRGARTEWSRSYKLKTTYGLTGEDFDALLQAQSGVCAICQRPPTGKHPLYVDHDHSCCSGRVGCGKCVRALLCGHCNRGLGAFRDNPELLYAAADYIKQHSKT